MLPTYRVFAPPASTLLVVLAVVTVVAAAEGQTKQVGERKLEPRADDRGGVRVEVVPGPLAEGRPAVFEVYFNTHSVDLGFEIQEIAALEDAAGITYRATAWEGSPPGGHHRSGRLIFPPVSGSRYLKLTLTGVGGVDRVFEWGERKP